MGTRRELTCEQIEALRRWSGTADGDERFDFIQEERARKVAEACGPPMVLEMLEAGVLANGENPVDVLRRLIRDAKRSGRK